jgi:DNA invertase Pin-like site-specific DNA recombinase
MAPKKTRVGIYVRVSTDSQTTANQRGDLERVAEQRGWEIVEVYTDQAVSGAKSIDKRPAFQRMCTDSAKGRINHIAAWALDRLGRSARDVINFITDLPEQGVSLYLHKEQLDTSTTVGKLVLTIMAGVAEMERDRIIERINAGIARARKEGKKLGRPRSTSSKAEQRIIRLSKTINPNNPAGAHYGKHAIAHEVGCGVSTVQRVLRQHAEHRAQPGSSSSEGIAQ